MPPSQELVTLSQINISSYYISLKYILILSYNLCLSNPSTLLSTGFTSISLFALLIQSVTLFFSRLLFKSYNADACKFELDFCQTCRCRCRLSTSLKMIDAQCYTVTCLSKLQLLYSILVPWVTMPPGPVNRDQRFVRTYCLHLQP